MNIKVIRQNVQYADTEKNTLKTKQKNVTHHIWEKYTEFVEDCRYVAEYRNIYKFVMTSSRVVIVKIGYIRISTAEQNTARQEVLMKELNVGMIFCKNV